MILNMRGPNVPVKMGQLSFLSSGRGTATVGEWIVQAFARRNVNTFINMGMTIGREIALSGKTPIEALFYEPIGKFVRDSMDSLRPGMQEAAAHLRDIFALAPEFALDTGIALGGVAVAGVGSYMLPAGWRLIPGLAGIGMFGYAIYRAWNAKRALAARRLSSTKLMEIATIAAPAIVGFQFVAPFNVNRLAELAKDPDPLIAREARPMLDAVILRNLAYIVREFLKPGYYVPDRWKNWLVYVWINRRIAGAEPGPYTLTALPQQRYRDAAENLFFWAVNQEESSTAK